MENSNQTNTLLTFKLGNEHFAFNVDLVISILESQKITEIPNAPNYLKGMINLRGSVLPVIDSRVRFGMSDTKITANTCIVVLEIKTDDKVIKVGAMVDSVSEVINCKDSEIKPVPKIGTKYHAEFLLGMIHLETGFIMVLNSDQVFAFVKNINLENSKDAVAT